MLNHRTLLSTLALVLVAASFNASLPAQSVPKSQRDVMVFIAELAPGQPGPAQAFYNFVEFAAESLAVTTLSPQYRKVHVVKGSFATRANFSNRLDTITANSAVKAVDVIFVTHGLSGNVYFSNGGTSVNNVRNDILNKLNGSQRGKLRMMFSTACYGSSHRSAWIAAGFRTASGSKRIYADSAVSFPVFLANWASGKTFSQAVVAANNSDPLRIQDNLAKGVLQLSGYANWADVDSRRDISGSSSLRITSMP